MVACLRVAHSRIGDKDRASISHISFSSLYITNSVRPSIVSIRPLFKANTRARPYYELSPVTR